ncbi:hypothetical protein L7F22_023503 [Adiantum nelumboides]|nr:hypothetical protein [Adiantum nelumboides]
MIGQSYGIRGLFMSILEGRSPLEIVHSDIWGPCDHATSNGCRYFITFSDDYSRMTWVYFLKAKSEAFEVFLEFKVMVEKENGCHIKCLCTDGGGEYMSHNFDDYLREQGIRRQITCRYTPQQNGVAERKNRVIAEIARAMMNEMNMPLTYCAEAVHTAVHIMNQTPRAAIHEISPYERLYGIKSTISYMKVFGCVCYVHVPNEARKKMEPKAMKCIFLDYPVEKKGYKCYDPTTRQVYVSRDVRFCEHEPWYKPKPMTIEDEYEEQENVRRVVDESRPSTRTISGPHMTEESTGSVNPWSGRLRDKKQDEKEKKKMFEESSGDESFDEEHGLPHLRTPGKLSWIGDVQEPDEKVEDITAKQDADVTPDKVEEDQEPAVCPEIEQILPNCPGWGYLVLIFCKIKKLIILDLNGPFHETRWGSCLLDKEKLLAKYIFGIKCGAAMTGVTATPAFTAQGPHSVSLESRGSHLRVWKQTSSTKQFYEATTLQVDHTNYGPINIVKKGGSSWSGRLLSARNASSNTSNGNTTASSSSSASAPKPSTAVVNRTDLHARARRGPAGSNCC